MISGKFQHYLRIGGLTLVTAVLAGIAGLLWPAGQSSATSWPVALVAHHQHRPGPRHVTSPSPAATIPSPTPTAIPDQTAPPSPSAPVPTPSATPTPPTPTPSPLPTVLPTPSPIHGCAPCGGGPIHGHSMAGEGIMCPMYCVAD